MTKAGGMGDVSADPATNYITAKRLPQTRFEHMNHYHIGDQTAEPPGGTMVAVGRSAGGWERWVEVVA